jgi:hypothetical protein
LRGFLADGAWAAQAGDAIIFFLTLPDRRSGLETGARRRIANRHCMFVRG